MKVITVSVVLVLSLSFLILTVSAQVLGEPQVGVKEGDWVEYTVKVNGPMDSSSHNITWFRIDILKAEGQMFQANVTVRKVNGTITSSLWKFNFVEGLVEGWVIIPANLGIGDSFYDLAKSGNVTIEGEEQKNVAGATRTITHASDSIRQIKEWDKTTGIYTFSVEHPKNLTITSTAIATNMWTPQTFRLNPMLLSALIASSGAVIAASVMLVAQKIGEKPHELPRN